MSGGLPLGTKYLSWAPWNLKEEEVEKDRCPRCGEKKSFWSERDKNWVCKNCWNKWNE